MKKKLHLFQSLCVAFVLLFSFSMKAQEQIALNFDGTDDYIQTDYPGVLGSNARTVETWVKTDATSGEQLIASWGSDAITGRRFTVRLNNIGGTNYSIRVEIKGGGFNGTTVVNDGNWHHVAVTYNPDATSNKYKLYVDGVLDTENDITQTINTQESTNVLIGRRINAGFGGYFNGTMDEYRIWDVARTQAEIQANMDAELCGETPNLMAYFKMSDGVAEADNSAITSISDTSGNTYSGTLNNFTLTGTTSNFVGGSEVTLCDVNTTCEAIGDFNESFDAAVEMPDCWNTLKVNSTATHAKIEVVEENFAFEDAYSLPNHVRMFNQLDGSAEFYLITPELNNLNSADHQLRFFLFGNPSITVEAGTMADPEDGSTFTTVETFENSPAAYQEYIAVFDENYTNQHLAIKVTFTETFKNIYIDNVNWEPIPSCPKPTGLIAENITANSAALTWTAGGNETQWEIVYGEAGFDLEGGEGTTVSDNNDLGETIDQLAIGTDYDFYVKAICGDNDESEWSFIGSFTTLCDVYPLDYTQDFSKFLPNCWEEADAGNAIGGPSAFGSSNWVTANFGNNAENGQATKIILFGNSVSDWLISPEMDLSTAAELTYDVAVTDLNLMTSREMGTDDQVQVLITADGGNTWENLMTYDQENTPSATGDSETIDLSAYTGTVQIAFWATAGAVSDEGGSYDFFIDNFSVTTIVEDVCSEPSDITVSNIAETTVDLSWTENGDAPAWEIKYGTPGFAPETEGTPYVDNDGETGESLGVLESGTTYEVYIRAFCDIDEYSNWVGPVEFTTLEESCPAPSDFTSSNVTSSSVDFSWTETGDADFWAVRHGAPGFSPEDEQGTMTADTDGSEGITIEDLEPETEYDFYVAASCGLDVSDWTGPITVTTLAEEEPCEAIGDFNESFDAAVEMPDCWNTLKVNSTATHAKIEVVEENFAFEDAYSLPNHVRMFNQLDGSAEFYLITPELNNLNSADHQLRFFLFGNPSITVEAGTMADPEDGSTFTTVETFENSPAAYQEYIAVFDESYTNQHLAIKVTFTETFKNIYIDNVNWEPIPSCPKPTGLIAENITANSADLSWTAGGNETQWEIVYGEAGFDLEGGDGTTVSDNNDLGETIDQLAIGTDYDFYVKAICGDNDESEWSFIGTFTTLCDVYPLDYTEGFASYVPNCWEVANSGSVDEGPSDQGDSSWLTVNNFVNDSENGKAVKIILFGNAISDWLISPEIDLSAAANLTYDVGVTVLNGTTAPDNGMGEDDQMQVLITTDAGDTWENLMTYDQENTPSATGDMETIDLSAYTGTVQIAFWATTGTVSDEGGSYDFFVDNFAVSLNEEFCEAPTNVEVAPATDTTATVTWTENGDATEWEILYGETGFIPGDGTGTSIVDNDGTLGETITGLTEGTDYDVYVRALCDEDNLSDWSVHVTFTSLSLVSENFKSFKFYPNPVKDRLEIKARISIDEITVYNLLGQTVMATKPNAIETNLDLSHFQSGVYLMKVQVGGIVKTYRVIKE